MANFTQKAIKESFIKLLQERPLNKITVKDIVDDCGINRNSFYYHYQDIPSLTEIIVREDAERLIAMYPSIESLEKALDVAIEFAIQNKKAALHIFNSVSRDVFEQNLLNVCEDVITKYFDMALPEFDFKEEDRHLVIGFCKCECFGVVIDWMQGGMKNDLQADLKRFRSLLPAVLEKVYNLATSKNLS